MWQLVLNLGMIIIGVYAVFLMYFAIREISEGLAPRIRIFPPSRINSINNKVRGKILDQLDSTYDDVPIDGSNTRKKNIFHDVVTRIFSSIGLVRNDLIHDDITIKVYRRLLLRHSLLSAVEKMSFGHDVNSGDKKIENGILTKDALENSLAEEYFRAPHSYSHIKDLNLPLWREGREKLKILTQSTTHEVDASLNDVRNNEDSESQPYILLPAKLRAYNLAVTDLFVEKALSYLNRKAKSYNRFGFVLSCVAFSAIIFGTLVALSNTFDENTNGKFATIVKEWFIKKNVTPSIYADIPESLRNYIDKMSTQTIDPYISSAAAEGFVKFISSDQSTIRWIGFISAFVKGFTFYGLLVMLAVFAYRMARALFDQAERLKDRRHALRQGRLFVHLNGGKMSVDEMEKAFNWNMSSDNAFANINPDAQAPWGNVVKEMLKTIRETSKAGIKAAERK